VHSLHLVFSPKASPTILIRNAKIVPVSGPILTLASVLTEDEFIIAVAQVTEGEALTLEPGPIDGLSSLGLEAAPAIVPVAVRGGPSPEDRALTMPWITARAAGFTTAVSFPTAKITSEFQAFPHPVPSTKPRIEAQSLRQLPPAAQLNHARKPCDR